MILLPWNFEAGKLLHSIVLASMMLFKRSFGLTRSLFILYVHQNDRLGFGMFTTEFDLIPFVDLGPVTTEKVSLTSRILFGIGRRVLEGKIFCTVKDPRKRR